MDPDLFFSPLGRALMGGTLIGLATSSLLLLNGRVAGISGIVGGLLSPTRGDTGWRVGFVAGLITGGFLLLVLTPGVFVSAPSSLSLSSLPHLPLLAGGGLLVGFGTRLGSGCTSGHGVCGIGRLSPRSIVATLTFISTGAVAVFVLRWLTGGLA